MRIKRSLHSSIRGALCALLVAASVSVVPSTGLAREGATSKVRGWDDSVLVKIPAKDRDRPNPLEQDADAVAAGHKLYDDHCSECHGKDAEGGRRGPSLRSDGTQKATPGDLFYLMTNGVIRRGMPDWSKLPEPQRWQLVSFLKSLQSAPLK